MIRAPSVHSQDDPLSFALRPPSSETEEQRQVRLGEEAAAKEISDKIDEEIKLDKQRLQKAKGDVKVCFRWRNPGASRSVQCFVASPTWAGRVRQIDSAETVPIDV
jgi:hypothetical protein